MKIGIIRTIIAGVACFLIKDTIEKKLEKWSYKYQANNIKPIQMEMTCKPGSDYEKRFMKVFSDNSDKFIGMHVQLAGVFNTEYNKYIFEIWPGDLSILNEFKIDFV